MDLRRILLLAGLGAFFAGHAYWESLNLFVFTTPGLLGILPALEAVALALALGTLARGGGLGLVSAGFAVALGVQATYLVVFGLGPVRYALPFLGTIVGYALVTWSALATHGVEPAASRAAVGRGLLVAGIAGLGWLYGNVTDGGYVWMPGAFTAGPGGILAWWALREPPSPAAPRAPGGAAT